MFNYEVRQSVTSQKPVYSVSPGGGRSCTGFSSPVETTVLSMAALGNAFPRVGEIIARLGKVDRIEHDLLTKLSTVVLHPIETSLGDHTERAIQELLDSGFSIVEVIDRVDKATSIPCRVECNDGTV